VPGPAGWHTALSNLAIVSITVALAAIGLRTQLDAMRQAGHRSLVLATLTWATVA